MLTPRARVLLRPLVSLPAAALLLQAGPPPAQAQAQVQLQCSGTLLEARGTAELRREASRFSFSLGLEAEAETADQALEILQGRLGAVRQELKALGVDELEVTSPNTWERGRSGRRPSAWVASLRVSGKLALERLQPLVRRVGGLPGVRLSPVSTEARPEEDRASRQQLLRAAYQDALQQARDLAGVIGLRDVRAIQVQVEGGPRPVPLRAMVAEAAPDFDPAELPAPLDRLGLQVWFCAR
ncbi:conserved hypothetical protein [Cyanobium sp. PCC 7001]|uniref:SIMPL domain-containing protein n=1 Tax=Cyanobium sp. PCC 7001 TaxID=180281 RepID=UPI0001805447|nr:SIMPL domain-containing protein [Cyanobium sp. PCC 7001]EDY37770.1 conserved hypothetical protein [Cyanobium sp. PCC 7001]